MGKKVGVLLIIIGIIGLFFGQIIIPKAKNDLKAMIPMAMSAKTSPEAWHEVYLQSRKLPPLPPFGRVKRTTRAVRDLTAAAEDLSRLSLPEFGTKIPKETIHSAFGHLQSVQYNLRIIDKNVQRVPHSLVPENYEEEVGFAQDIFTEIRPYLANIDEFRRVVDEHFAKNAKMLIWLGNPNETRPSGGFAGSLLLLHFDDDGLGFEFSDTYALDRLVPPSAWLDAPEFLHPVAKKLSLRDVNIHPDFADVAADSRYFFLSLGREAPDTVLGVNLSLIGEILRRTGPIKLPPYNVMLDEGNFDMVLAFLVGSKAAGRYSVKDPVFAFGKELFRPEILSKVPISEWLSFDIKQYLAEKNILADSELRYTQEMIEKWALTSEFMPKNDADDFLQFSFANVGSNKTDRFSWSRIIDNVELTKDGKAVHTMTIKRTHSLHEGELEGTLKLQSWPRTLRELFTDNMAWILGKGENRVSLRIHVPKNASILGYENPSGVLKNTLLADGQIRELELPMYVKPGESLDVKLTYSVPINRGSSAWRPYFLHLSPSSHQPKTEFIHNVTSTGQITEQTTNVGGSQRLIASGFRTLVLFDDQLIQETNENNTE